MPAETMNEMILGFAVIIGILVIYVLLLVIRFHKETAQRKDNLNK